MVGSWSRLGKTLLRNSSRLISMERNFARNLKCVLGESGLVGYPGCRDGSIWKATFGTSSDEQLAFTGSEYSCSNNVASVDGLAVPNSRHWAACSTTEYVQVLPGVKFEVSTNSGWPSLAAFKCLCFIRMGSQSTSLGPRVRPVILRTAPNGSRSECYDHLSLAEKVVARMSNVPKFLFKSDLLWLLKGCNLTPEDFLYVYDSKYRLKFIQIELSSVESFHLAQRTLTSKSRFGGRYLKLTSEDYVMDDINKVLAPFRGRSLLMLKVPFGVVTEDVERFFSVYALDSNCPIRFLRSPVQVPVGGNQGSLQQTKTDFEMRSIVRFRTELEALRAMREKQGAICLGKPIDLRFVS